MAAVRPITGATVAGVGLVALVFGGCTGPGAQPIPPTPAATRPAQPSAAVVVPQSSPAAAASASVVASLSPVRLTPSAQASPTTAASLVTPTVVGQASPVAQAEQPLAPETNPPGDIPDNQAFVTFSSPTDGYQLQVPESWGRTTSGSDVRFVDKLDGVQVTIARVSAAPTAATAQATQVADLQRSGRAVQVGKVQDVQLPAGPAVLIDYTANSDPDPVTSKQVRLENNAYLFYKDGKLATLTLWAPLGSDNVDQWQQMAQSFRWQ